MSRLKWSRKKAALRSLVGIRGRLVLLALIVIAPMMVERIRSLETLRSEEVAQATGELSRLARQVADSQREVVSSVQAVLRASAYIYSSATVTGSSCAILRSSMPLNLPWIRLIAVADPDGRVHCSTNAALMGANLADRAYFKAAIESTDFVLSDFVYSRANKEPVIVAAYPMVSGHGAIEGVVVGSLQLDWLSSIMSTLGGRPGVSAALVDAQGIVLAAPPDQKSMIGRPLDERLFPLHAASGPAAANHPQRAVNSVSLPGTSARLVVGIDEVRVNADISRDIRRAYIQIGFVAVLVLLGALVAAQRLIVAPIDELAGVAKTFGDGDWSARVVRSRFPAEFAPLARAFNGMAAQLSERQRGLVATNNRLSLIASSDPLSGLANRRGFQSRLDFEWLKAQQTGDSLALLMIDVDHFKLFNDTYGHPEGDACLTRIGATLAAIANETLGFAARYGGEEFCLLLPNYSRDAAAGVAELVRAQVERLDIVHSASTYRYVTVSVGVARITPDETKTSRDLVEAADAALYAAKHRGRNAVAEHALLRASSVIAAAG